MRHSQRRPPRLFLEVPLSGEAVTLTDGQAHYLRRVLRLKPGDAINVFNGAGEERSAAVEKLARNHATLTLREKLTPLAESPLNIVLIQALVKADAMDLIIQKATELGIHTIVPVVSDFSVVKLDSERIVRRLAHWQKIARGACEQSGRHRPLEIGYPQALTDALLETRDDYAKLVMHPHGTVTLDSVAAVPPEQSGVYVLIGPEGGLSETDMKRANDTGFESISLGPRVLRAETAAITACSLIQAKWGDLSA